MYFEGRHRQQKKWGGRKREFSDGTSHRAPAGHLNFPDLSSLKGSKGPSAHGTGKMSSKDVLFEMELLSRKHVGKFPEKKGREKREKDPKDHPQFRRRERYPNGDLERFATAVHVGRV